MRNTLKIITLGFFFTISLTGHTTEKPNFIFILTDDQYSGLMGCDGNTITQTPNIDKLAEEGVFFDNAHITSAICTPSRISILLSQFERKHGVNFNSGTSVAPEAWEKSYPVIMRNNGYYTGYIGKNHSPIGNNGYGSGLMEKSFDYFYAGHGHLTFYPKDRHEIFNSAEENTQVEIIDEGVEDFLSNEHKLEGAFRFLNSKPNEKPFCLSICFNLPHGASTSTMKMLESDPEIYKSLYRDIKIPLPENYIAKKDIKQPKLPADLLKVEERQHIYDYADTPEETIERTIRQMQAMTGIDKLIGNLRLKLKKEGLDKNTIIVFTSDHGLFMGEYGLGGKALCYEQTTNVPFIVYNPMAPKKAKERRLNNLVQSIDIAPTLLDYAGIEIPASFQGKSIKPLIEGKEQIVREYLFTENLWSTQFGNPRCEAVQNKEWKYIRYYKNDNFPASLKIKAAKELGFNVNQMLYATHDPDVAVYRHYIDASFTEEPVYEELYNLKNDPKESTNLAKEAKYAKVLSNMRKAWAIKLKNARGEGKPGVLRYTKDSMLENNKKVELH